MLPLFKRIEHKLRQTASWTYVPVVLFTLGIIDFFLLVIPLDAFVLAAILGCRRKTLHFAIAAILGKIAALGILYYVSLLIPVDKLAELAKSYQAESAWAWGSYFFEKFGPLSLGVISISPISLPQQAVALMSLLAGSPFIILVTAFFLGLVVRYLLLVGALRLGVKCVKQFAPQAP